MPKAALVTELNSLLAREPFQPFRIRLVNGDYHDVGQTKQLAFLSWGIYVTEYQTHWASFTYESIVGFDSLVEFEA